MTMVQKMIIQDDQPRENMVLKCSKEFHQLDNHSVDTKHSRNKG